MDAVDAVDGHVAGWSAGRVEQRVSSVISADGSTFPSHGGSRQGALVVLVPLEDCGETAPLPGPGEGLTSRRVWSREDWFISTTQRFPGPPSILVVAEGGQVLGIGIDWAEEFHDIALGTQEKGVVEQFRIEHGPAGVATLIERALRLEPDPAEVRVVLETRHGLLVEALVDAGFTVVPVNPDVVARRRGPARKKDDAEDARICC
ncbi:MAG: IS110 family transposase, partial [Actinobacteria bacterium]|nr:IS110 family transposase [Actinomycetota bacterium]